MKKWAIPSAAWRKEFGDVDWDKTSDSLRGGAHYVDRTAVGIPLGGFGAGNFEYNITGTFGPWELVGGKLERRYLDTAAFHARVRVPEANAPQGILAAMAAGKQSNAVAKTLAAESKLSGSANQLTSGFPNRLRIGSADYYALYPKGWVDYRDNFKAELCLEFFSPIIADNYRETSLPVAYFNYHAANPTQETMEVDLMFTFPNAPIYCAKSDPVFMTSIIGGAGSLVDGDPAILRKGLKNRLLETDRAVGVLMSSDSAENDPIVQGSEYCIATPKAEGVTITVAPSWNADTDASKLFHTFAETGTVSHTDTMCDHPAGALCVSLHLEPGEARVIPFVLSWNFPVCTIGTVGSENYQLWWRRYTEYYPPSSDDRQQWKLGAHAPAAWHMALDALQNLEQTKAQVDGWMDRYLSNPNFAGKEWILTAGFNELYYTAMGYSFWENGLIFAHYHDKGALVETNAKKFGDRDYTSNPLYADQVEAYQQKRQYLHFCSEAPEFPMAETFDVRGHSHRTYTDLWPEIERDILLVYKDFIMDNPQGACPHDAGGTYGKAFFVYDGYWEMMGVMNGEAYAEYLNRWDTTPWSEFSPKFILYAYEYWEKTKDAAFLRDVWEAMVRSYIYERSTDTDNDGVTNMKSSEYDRNDLFNAILCVGAWNALETLCATHPEFADTRVKYQIATLDGTAVADVDDFLSSDVARELKKLRTFIEEKLWNEQDGYYQFNPEYPIIMADAFIGQAHCFNAKLPLTVDLQRLARHCKTTYKYNVGTCYSKTGGFGHSGAKNLYNMNPGVHYKTNDGIVEHNPDIWTGVTYVLAANMYKTALLCRDTELKEAALDTAHGVYFTTYQDSDTAYYFNTPEAWQADDPRISRNRMYQRARGAWELLRAVAEETC